ncbi:hypothetical protein [Lysinibacillus sp. JNUCC 51]|nr:hypothetical protein JNUCC51_17530 [Lysinibacillus sp. JNUCC-51]
MDALFICVKAKRQQQMFSVAKAKRQQQMFSVRKQQLGQGENDRTRS